MVEPPPTRRIECPSCGHEFQIALLDGFDHPDIECPRCGTQLSDHAKAVEFAREEITLDEAKAIAGRYTYDQIIDMATRGFEAGSLTPEERDVVVAFVRLRAAGLPGHAPDRSQ
jgi:hypothetical protein